MLSKFQNHLHTNLSFLEGKKLLLAVSGGIDSMVLVDLCFQLKLDFAVAHCNFQLRGEESDADESFVSSQTEKLQVPLFIQKFDTQAFAEQQKMSIQVVARNLRYEWFYTLLAQHQFDYLLTAHHLDDSVETFLINFTRGSGLEGLLGIPQQNDKMVRPLLVFSRSEIQNYASENNIPWREDSSNASDKYVRNKLRHEVIPVLKALNPSFLASFENTIGYLKQSQSLAEDAAAMVYQKVATEEEHHTVIDLKALLSYPNYRAYLFAWLQPFGFTDWAAVYDLLDAQSGKQVLSDSHILLKNRGVLLLFPKQTPVSDEVYWIPKDQTEVKVPLKMSFCEVVNISNQTSNVIFVDENLLQFPLTLRRWQEGDIFYPFGMTGRKKLSKFFKDEKYSLRDKANVWLLCSDAEIVWIVGKRQDERFKVTASTTKILKIKYTR
ncbi:tRNA lysidine(34) synthetase TilS [Flavobacterium sedimenticola]|uniref:tRNA(Ile)-lysidine synthase n=1 Tax=Flavobacterium sedimenticola TaxID=3043286 RepID=A0ABT6XPR7_9FLAO|nr:tRNA lysidine(34) synthetase TilS [Flavobacterium sedimenticola]MDI9257075.1 tRNA lysidine(34) synthetase TilS [Flavobacterium sedimenticola]